MLTGNRVLCVFELMRGGFDVLADLAGALDDAGNEIDPVLREVLAAGPFGIGVNAVGVLQGDRVDGQLAMKGSGVVGIGRDDIELVDEGRIEGLKDSEDSGGFGDRLWAVPDPRCLDSRRSPPVRLSIPRTWFEDLPG